MSRYCANTSEAAKWWTLLKDKDSPIAGDVGLPSFDVSKLVPRKSINSRTLKLRLLTDSLKATTNKETK